MTPIRSIDPRTGQVWECPGRETSPEKLDQVCGQAVEACDDKRFADRAVRADLLRGMARQLESGRDDVVATADRETALGAGRLSGELTRTCYQLRLFADALDEGSYLEATIDHAGETPMGPRPDLRRMLVPLGPVAVFGASNFPLAFSVPGGDTAAALAAGCPVVVKAHPSHPATSAACHRLLSRAVERAGIAGGVVELVYGQGAGTALVRHSSVRAAAFTGSLGGARALERAIAERDEPIPFYGELSSLNPVVITTGAAAARGAELASGVAASYLLGAGQFCSKPGLVFVPTGECGDAFVDAVANQVRDAPATMLLNENVRDGFERGTQRLARSTKVVATGSAVSGAGFGATPTLCQTTADRLDGEALDEVFGPVTVLVRFDGSAQLHATLRRLPGSLTATVHAEPSEQRLVEDLTAVLRQRAGRLLYQGFPTGVAVSWAQHHGGPWPATTTQHSSVGVSSLRRFLRPLAYQDASPGVLPPELRDGPAEIPRRVDGRLELPATYDRRGQ